MTQKAALLSLIRQAGGGGVSSVFGRSGVVTALVGDYSAFYQPLAAVLTNTTASFTAALETKLLGIATGATANDTDAALRARASHTGTQLAATISDFDIQVRTSRLDQMAVPTASVDFSGQQATSFRIENRTSDPGSPATGQIWLRTDL